MWGRLLRRGVQLYIFRHMCCFKLLVLKTIGFMFSWNQVRCVKPLLIFDVLISVTRQWHYSPKRQCDVVSVLSVFLLSFTFITKQLSSIFCYLKYNVVLQKWIQVLHNFNCYFWINFLTIKFLTKFVIIYISYVCGLISLRQGSLVSPINEYCDHQVPLLCVLCDRLSLVTLKCSEIFPLW